MLLQDRQPRPIVIWSVLLVDSGTDAGTFTQTTSMCANVGEGPPGSSENSSPFLFLDCCHLSTQDFVSQLPSVNFQRDAANVTIRTADTRIWL